MKNFFCYLSSSKISLYLLSFSVILFNLISVGSVAAAGFHEADPIPCYDVSGSGKEVNVNGVPNSGIMQFDIGPGKALGPAPQYEACVRVDSNNPDKAQPSHLQGWVWNNNLGWISLYCGDDDHDGSVEASDIDGIKQNLGVNCGNIDYQVDFVVSGSAPDFTSVALNGYAWGDNTGYIAFNGPGWQLQLETVDPNKGKVIAKPLYKHTWADSVGWFDLEGVTMPWFGNPVEEVKICTDKGKGDDPNCPCNLVNGEGCTAESDPYADGIESWNIQFGLYDSSAGKTISNLNSFIDINCNGVIPLNTSAVKGLEYYVCIMPIWQDLVDYDQTTASSQDPNVNYNANNNGPVQKPLNTSDIQFNGKFWERKVTSYAPTSNTNVDDKGRSSEKFIYPNDLSSDGFNYAVNNANNGGNNTLTLQRLDILVLKYGNPGQCLYGEVVGTNCVTKAYLQNIALKFKPLMKLGSLYFKDTLQNKNIEFINALANEASQFNYTIIKQNPLQANSAQLKLKIGLNSDAGYKFNFEDTPGSNTFDQDIDEQIFNENTADGSLYAMPLPVDPNNPPTFSENVEPFLYSVVNYLVKNAPQSTKFFSVKLPRIKAGLIKNPVAFVLGNVYGTSLGVKSQDVKVRSLGNLSSNIFRNNIVQNVYKLIAGYGNNAGGSTTVSGWNGNQFTFSGIQPVKIPGKNVYYLKNGDLTFACASETCSWKGKWTFIVENGHIFVNSNLIPDLSADPNSALGLIALRDLSVLTSKANMYLEAKVTDMYQTNIYLDGSLFSYKNDGTHGIGGASNGYEPIFADDFDRQETLANQFKLYGSLSSANCIGCASSVTPTDGDGKRVGNVESKYATMSTPSQGIASARVDDLNYLRYFGPYLELCSDNTPRDQQLKVNGDPNSGCNPNLPSYIINATQLVNQGGDLIMPTADIGKKSQKALDQDIYPTIFQQFLPPRDLPAFEVGQEINPTQVI